MGEDCLSYYTLLSLPDIYIVDTIYCGMLGAI